MVNSFWNLVDLLGGGALSSANWVPHILSVFCLSLWVVASVVRTGALLRTSGGMLAMITLGATMLHIQYGSTGAFFRYEAYIVTLGIVIGGLALDDLLSRVPDERVRWHNLPKLLAVAVMVFALVVPVVKRTATAAKQTPLASQNIFDQQVRMGRFLRDH